MLTLRVLVLRYLVPCEDSLSVCLFGVDAVCIIWFLSSLSISGDISFAFNLIILRQSILIN